LRSARTRSLVASGLANSCYFRTAADDGARKALIQITERCNLHCAHCFVSSTRHGKDLDLEQIRDIILPRLRTARVERITLTGGEPFVHPDILPIAEATVYAGFSLGICTNASCVTDDHIARLSALDGVHVNVSFDGFRPESHGRFRGNLRSFEQTVATTRALAETGLLQGILSTPNALTNADEYRDLAAFAADIGATYILMNPLSPFGRGARSERRLAADAHKMEDIEKAVQEGAQGELEVVPIRFPNRTAPLAPCVAGNIVYVFADGLTAVCPYLVFAARSERSRYPDDAFLVGNILETEVAEKFESYRFHERFTVGANPTCEGCVLDSDCGKGCPAAVVARGGLIGDRDEEHCPFP
jgi:radical SAM protein with 4Fe4S-binding SPASM domain